MPLFEQNKSLFTRIVLVDVPMTPSSN